MGFLSNLFGGKRKQEILDALIGGAKIVDVRTKSEFNTGNIEGSINIPIDQLNDKTIKKLKKLNTPVVVCCASGSRSGAAKGMLKNAGIDAVNGGSWHKVYNLVMAD